MRGNRKSNPENRRPNPKRRVARAEDVSLPELEKLAAKVKYTGNPAHKSGQKGFDLAQSASLRPGKTLCDLSGITHRRQAVALLREGLRRGVVRDRCVRGWPKQVWAVADTGVVFEAQYDGVGGSYHGYPLAEGDPFRQRVIDAWNAWEAKK